MTINVSEVLEKTDELIEEEINENLHDQEEILNVLFNIQNLSWTEFASKEEVSDIKIMNVDTDPPIKDEQVLLGVIVNGKTEFSVSTNDHLIPYVEEFDVNVRSTTKNDSVLKGVFIQYVSKEPIDSSMWGIDCYIPFANQGKKIVGVFNLDAPTKRYFSVKTYPIANNVDSPEKITESLRSSLDPLNDMDKILFIDASSRIEKMSESWVTVQSALIEINNLIENTIDPNYIVKLMKLNKDVVKNSVQNTENSSEVVSEDSE